MTRPLRFLLPLFSGGLRRRRAPDPVAQTMRTFVRTLARLAAEGPAR